MAVMQVDANRAGSRILESARKAPVAGSVLLIPLIGYADYQTGVDISLSLFYLLPVAVASWYGGRLVTLAIAVACAATWFVTNSSLLHVYHHPVVLLWNTAVRLAMFLIVGLLLVRTRDTRDHLEFAVAEKTELLQQQIVQRKKNEREFFALVQRNREAVAFELHDGLAQFLTAIAMKTKALERELADRSLPERESAEKLVQLLNDAVGQTREIARGLSPLDTDASDLVAAMRRLAAETTSDFGVKCESSSSHSELRFGNDASVHLYRIAQQAVANAVQHGNPELIQLGLNQMDGHLQLTIHDDGDGFDPAAVSHEGLGLQTMALRADFVGGQLEVRSAPGQGTDIEVTAKVEGLLDPPEGEAQRVPSPDESADA